MKTPGREPPPAARRAPTSWTDTRIEARMGTLLRDGVLLAAIVIALGGLLYLVRHGGEAPAYAAFHGEPASLRTLPGIATAAAFLTGRGVIQLGLLLLVATPIARVAFAILAFALQRDRLYTLLGAWVLANLLYGLIGH